MPRDRSIKRPLALYYISFNTAGIDCKILGLESNVAPATENLKRARNVVIAAYLAGPSMRSISSSLSSPSRRRQDVWRLHHVDHVRHYLDVGDTRCRCVHFRPVGGQIWPQADFDSGRVNVFVLRGGQRLRLELCLLPGHPHTFRRRDGRRWGVGSSLAMETIPDRWRGWVSRPAAGGYPCGYFLATLLFGFAYHYLGWRACSSSARRRHCWCSSSISGSKRARPSSS